MQFDFRLIGSALELFGKVLLAIAVLMVHQKMVSEHKIDKVVTDEIHHEQILTYISIAFMVFGFFVKSL